MDIDVTNQEVTKIGSMNWSKRNLDVSILNGNEIPYASSTEAIKKYAKTNNLAGASMTITRKIGKYLVSYITGMQ